jgi:eukaryotic-like serine/threonine-protein kinase
LRFWDVKLLVPGPIMFIIRDGASANEWFPLEFTFLSKALGRCPDGCAMAIPQTIEGFLTVLRQSGLTPNGCENTVLAELAGQGVEPTDAQDLAQEFVRREILTAWQAEMLLQGKNRGFLLGPYVVLRALGHGTMGSVFLAQHVLMNRRCAIKVLPNKYRADPDLLNHFQIEARAIAALDHPNIVRAYDFNRYTSAGSDVYYLVMEYVEGQDLQRIVTKEGMLAYQRAADIIRQAALGLAFAHEAGFVHRDIKPANLMVDGKGVLKILDLGLATLAREADQGAQAGAHASGTPDYMAPEQIVASGSLDGRADIYSLGLTFYFLLVGRRPFIKSTVAEIFGAHRNEEPLPIEETRPDVPFELTSIFKKMTTKSPEQRYKNAGDVATALQTWLQDLADGRPSRLAAIRSMAMRSRQQGTSGPSDVKPPATEGVGLELKPLEEQPPCPTVSGRAPSAGTKRSRTSEKDAPVPDRSPADRDSDRATPANLAPPAAKPDVAVSEPFVLFPELPFLTPPPRQVPPKVAKGWRTWWGRSVREVQSSPWLWAGVGALFVAVLILIVVLCFWLG